MAGEATASGKPRKRQPVIVGRVAGQRRAARRFGLGLLALMLALTVAAGQQICQLWGGVTAQMAADTLQAPGAGEALPQSKLLADLRRADRRYRAAPFQAGDTAQLAYAHMVAALRLGSWSVAAKRHLRLAEDLYRASLRQAPANSFAWARLAQTMTLAGKPAEQAIPAWGQSIETAPFEPELLLWRTDFGLAHKSFLSGRQKRLLREQIAQAWQRHPWGVSRVLAKHQAPQYLEKALTGDEAALKKFRKNYFYANEERKAALPKPPEPPRKGKGKKDRRK